MRKRDPFVVLDQKIVKLSQSLFETSWLLTPVNLRQEKEKFFRVRHYHPVFRYAPFKTQPVEERLSWLKIPPGYPLTELFQEIKSFLYAYLQVLKNRGLKDFTNTSLFDLPSPRLVQQARLILKQPVKKPQEKKRYSSSDLAGQLRKLIANFGIKGWRVVITSRKTTRISVNPAQKIISLKREEKFSLKDLKKIKAHEIEAHFLRSVNGYLQPYKIFAIQIIPGYLPTEEGLALFNEEKVSILGPYQLKLTAGRALAIHYALHSSFRETYHYLLKFFSPQEAFQITLRVKRGLGDTSQPGGFIKDHVYLQGKILIENYIKKGGQIKPLYAGKIGLQHLELLKKGVLKPPKYLPEYWR